MTYLLTVDPGLNTGAALGWYDDTTPYKLLERYQIHDGLPGFVDWVLAGNANQADVLVVESFVLDPENEFTADLTPVHIEGAILTLQATGTPAFPRYVSAWQPRTAKGDLIGYPDDCKTPTKRQRFRFDFLDRFGFFAAGTENDDSNDAITHALVYLRRQRHMPTMLTFWPSRGAPTLEEWLSWQA